MLTPCLIQLISLNVLSPDDIWRMFFVVLLLCASAMVSGSETAFFSLSPHQVNQLKSHSSRSDRVAISLFDTQSYLLATILIANNLINICIVILSNSVIDSWISFGDSIGLEFLLKMVLVTFLLLLFGEIMPKIFASYNSMRVVRIMAIPLMTLKHFFKPLSYILIHSSNHINETVSKKRVNISIDELSNAIEITTNQNVEEKKILSGIVEFVNTEVVEIMKSRVDVIALDMEDNFDRVKQIIIGSGFSRIPVYTESLDNIKGILYVKDLLPYIANGEEFEWQNLCRKPYFVPEHKKINDLLEEFQAQQTHIAIVVDEYGSTMGLVSLEDILEEIVGEISDESDVEQNFYTKVAPNVYIFEGKTHISELIKILDLDDEYLDYVKGEAETVAGLMLEIKKEFLSKGDLVYCKELTLVVEDVDGRRIDKVRVTVGKPKE